MRKIVTLLFTMLLSCSFAWSQTGIVEGNVKDPDGNAVAFATVNVKGTKVSTAVSATGTFKIAAKKGDVLVVTAIGYQTTEFTISSESGIVITLAKGTGTLQDVVVTTALGVQRQSRSLGYATTKISSAELTQAKVTNAATGLAGKVAGLQITLANNGVKPAVRANFRGNRSFLGNNQALLVVDGNILPINFLSTINPNDIENINTLNGASASALYGSAGSNGVIVVTTKRGAKGKATVTVTSTVSQQSISYLPDFQNQYGAGSLEDGRLYPGLVYFPEDPFQPYVPYENQSFGPAFNGQKVPLGPPIRIYNADGSYTIQQDSMLYSAKPNAKRDFFDKGLTIQNDVSLSTGDDKSRFYMSFQDVSVTGNVPGDKDHRNTFRVNGSRDLGKFKADYNFGYTIGKTNTSPGTFSPFAYGNSGSGGFFPVGTGNQIGGGSYFQGRPVYYTVISQPASTDLREYRNWQTDPFASPDGFYNAYYGNPWWQIDQTRLDERTATLLGSASLTFKAFDWLNFTYRLSAMNESYNNKYTKAGYDFAPWAEADTLQSGNIPSSIRNLAPTEGDAFSAQQRITSDFIANFSKNITDDLNIGIILGNQVTSNFFRFLNASSNALLLPDFYNISNRIGEPNVGESRTQSRTIGNFTDVTLGYKKMLFGEFTLRNDRVSVLPESNRSFWYPGGNIALVFTELWQKRPDWLTYGKVHIAASKVGQVNIGAYSTENVFPVASGFPYGSITSFTVGNQFANPNLKPEYSNEKEVGIELSFLNDRINIQTNLYKTNTINQTIPAAISSTTGYSTNVVNSGEMLNKGVEMTLSAQIIKTKNLVWTVGGNFSYNYNKVLFLTNDLIQTQIGATDAYVVKGYAYPQVEVTDWLRDDQGRIIVDKATGLPTIDPNLKIIGTSNPPRRIGINTSLKWKGFTFSALADGRFGAVIFNDVGDNMEFTGVTTYSTQTGRQAFVIPNSSYNAGTPDKPNYVANTNITTIDGNVNFWAFNWNNVGSNYVTSADFWKLREVSLSYDIPQSVISKLKVVKALNFGLVGRNLIMIKSKQNYWADPEFSITTGNGLGTTDINQTPPTRFLGASISITF